MKLVAPEHAAAVEEFVSQYQRAAGQLRALIYRASCPQLIKFNVVSVLLDVRYFVCALGFARAGIRVHLAKLLSLFSPSSCFFFSRPSFTYSFEFALPFNGTLLCLQILGQITECSWDSKKMRTEVHDWVPRLVSNCRAVWDYMMLTEQFAESSPLLREQVCKIAFCSFSTPCALYFE